MKKFLVCLCVICIMFSSMAFAEVDIKNSAEDIEPNNSMSEANDTPKITETTSVEIRGSVFMDDTEDWFKCTSSFSGESKFVVFGFGAGCRLYLYNEHGRLLNPGGEIKDYVTDVFIRKDETYYVRVVFDGGTSPEPWYALVLDVIK